MSPFSIYAIVLTIALILYYITLITMDLNAKNKKDNNIFIFLFAKRAASTATSTQPLAANSKPVMYRLSAGSWRCVKNT